QDHREDDEDGLGDLGPLVGLVDRVDDVVEQARLLRRFQDELLGDRSQILALVTAAGLAEAVGRLGDRQMVDAPEGFLAIHQPFSGLGGAVSASPYSFCSSASKSCSPILWSCRNSCLAFRKSASLHLSRSLGPKPRLCSRCFLPRSSLSATRAPAS